ncbi:AP-3 complex subunit mu-2, partial [Perkinsus olseni]
LPCIMNHVVICSSNAGFPPFQSVVVVLSGGGGIVDPTRVHRETEPSGRHLEMKCLSYDLFLPLLEVPRMSLCYSPIPSEEDDGDDANQNGVPLIKPSILPTNSPFVLRPDPYAPDLATLYRPNDDTPVCDVQHPYTSLNAKITHASVVEDDDEPEPSYLFLGYDFGQCLDLKSKEDRLSQIYNAGAVLGWDCRTGEVIDSVAIPGASCMYVRGSSSGMVAATTIYERIKPRKRRAFYRPQTTIYVYVYTDNHYHLLKPIAPRGYRSSPVAMVADSTCARFMVILTKNGRLLHQHLLGPSISTEVTALKDGPGPEGAELALLNDDMTGILLERSRPRVVIFIAEARHGVEVLQQVDLRAVMEASGQNFSQLLTGGALLPHFGGEGFAVLWKDNYIFFDMYSDTEGVKRACQKTRTVASLKRPSGIDLLAAVPTTVHWLAVQLSDDRLLWRWWSPGETLIKEEPSSTGGGVKEEPA